MASFNAMFERDNVTGRNHEGPYFNTPLRVLTASSIIGDAVETGNGEMIGKIYDIVCNIERGEINYIIISIEVFSTISDKIIAIPFKNFQLNPSKKVFVLNIENKYLEKAPYLKYPHFPESNNQYFTDSSNYWESYPSYYAGSIGPVIN